METNKVNDINQTSVFKNNFYLVLEKNKKYRYYQRKKAIKLLISILLWTTILLLLFSNVFNYKIIFKKNIIDVDQLDSEVVKTIKKTNYFLIDSQKTKKKILLNENIEDVIFKKNLFKNEIIIVEKEPVLIYGDYFVFSNNSFKLIEEYDFKSNYEKIANLIEMDQKYNNNTIFKLVEKVSKLDKQIYQNIENIYLEKISDLDYYYIHLHLNDDNLNFKIITELDYLDTKLTKKKYQNILDEIIIKNDIINADSLIIVSYFYNDENLFKIGSADG